MFNLTVGNQDIEEVIRLGAERKDNGGLFVPYTIKPINGFKYLTFQKWIKLSVELIPHTAWGSNMRTLISPQLWKEITKETSKKYGYKCAICGGKGDNWWTECHEQWEYINNIQKLVNLISLCPTCHKIKHITRSLHEADEEEKERLINHMKHINSWQTYDVMVYLEECNKKFQLESKTAYDIDIRICAKAMQEIEGLTNEGNVLTDSEKSRILTDSEKSRILTDSEKSRILTDSEKSRIVGTEQYKISETKKKIIAGPENSSCIQLKFNL